MQPIDHSAEMIALMQQHTARYIYRFSMQGYPSTDWELVRVQPTANSAELRACLYQWKHRRKEGLMLRYEVLECSSVRHARKYVKDMRSRSTTPQHISEGHSGSYGSNDLIASSDYSQLKVVNGRFWGVAVSRHNLGFAMRVATRVPMELGDLGDISPTEVFKTALNKPEFNQHIVRLEVEHSSIKAGESTGLRLHFESGNNTPLWAIVLTDSKLGGIRQEEGKLRYHTQKEHPAGAVTVYVAWFDAHFRKAFAAPQVITIVR